MPEPTSPFFRIPKELITSDEYRGLSVAAKFLYGVLLDRLALSNTQSADSRFLS
ncbi:MAG: replication initiator protein A [Butyrivibrio sp.]|nr:replication initiator protein A [Butyrivibrio sp.]